MIKIIILRRMFTVELIFLPWPGHWVTLTSSHFSTGDKWLSFTFNYRPVPPSHSQSWLLSTRSPTPRPRVASWWPPRTSPLARLSSRTSVWCLVLTACLCVWAVWDLWARPCSRARPAAGLSAGWYSSERRQGQQCHVLQWAVPDLPRPPQGVSNVLQQQVDSQNLRLTGTVVQHRPVRNVQRHTNWLT